MRETDIACVRYGGCAFEEVAALRGDAILDIRNAEHERAVSAARRR